MVVDPTKDTHPKREETTDESIKGIEEVQTSLLEGTLMKNRNE